MTFEGFTAAGVRCDLGIPVSVRINRGEDAPADDFTGLFPWGGADEPISRIRVMREGQLCFFGFVDEQAREFTEDGAVLKIVARSRAALLLDNEAMPQAYCAPHFSTVFRRHAAPYGFSRYEIPPGGKTGEFSVSKGMSEWQVLESFCRRYLSAAPRITRGDVFLAGVRPADGPVVFGGLSGGIPWTSLSIRRKDWERISDVFVQSKRGDYTTRVPDDETARMGIVRKRYLSASGGVSDAGRVLAAARRRSFELELECPAWADAEPGTPAVVRGAPGGEISGLSVYQVSCSLTGDGERTAVVLRREK